MFLALVALAGLRDIAERSEQRAADQLAHPTGGSKEQHRILISRPCAKILATRTHLICEARRIGQAGEYEKAIVDFSTAIQINPQFYQAYNNRALIYLRVGRYDAASNDYNQA